MKKNLSMQVQPLFQQSFKPLFALKAPQQPATAITHITDKFERVDTVAVENPIPTNGSPLLKAGFLSLSLLRSGRKSGRNFLPKNPLALSKQALKTFFRLRILHLKAVGFDYMMQLHQQSPKIEKASQAMEHYVTSKKTLGFLVDAIYDTSHYIGLEANRHTAEQTRRKLKNAQLRNLNKIQVLVTAKDYQLTCHYLQNKHPQILPQFCQLYESVLLQWLQTTKRSSNALDALLTHQQTIPAEKPVLLPPSIQKQVFSGLGPFEDSAPLLHTALVELSEQHPALDLTKALKRYGVRSLPSQ